MKYMRLVLVCLFVVFLSCAEKKKMDNVKHARKDQETALLKEKPSLPFPIYDYDGLEPLLNKNDDKTYIVNFWATWCKPCVEEMPYFEQTFAEQKQNNVELILVSLDMPSMWEKRLVPFVEKKELKGQVVILDDPKMNDWIPKIDQDWGGGIPATLIYNKDARAFYEQGFTYEELNSELDKFLKH